MTLFIIFLSMADSTLFIILLSTLLAVRGVTLLIILLFVDPFLVVLSVVAMVMLFG
jgi:hypothetical protein